eukprot:796321-Rhodomonas_salina.3
MRCSKSASGPGAQRASLEGSRPQVVDPRQGGSEEEERVKGGSHSLGIMIMVGGDVAEERVCLVRHGLALRCWEGRGKVPFWDGGMNVRFWEGGERKEMIQPEGMGEGGSRGSAWRAGN